MFLKIKSMDFCFIAVLLSTLLPSAFSIKGTVSKEEKNPEFWRKNAERTLLETLLLHKNENVAKNVILFLGDGMGLPTVTSMRIYKGQKKNQSGETELLSFDRFPHVSLSKTYGVDRQLSDSANTATAYLCGVKGNYGTAGVDGNVLYENCESALNKSNHVYSIMQWAQQAGKWTGFVTSTRVTHATPSGLYAHTASRDWESSAPDSRCIDIAQQLIHDEPGKNARVILGGGRKHFIPTGQFDVDGEQGQRTDSRDLLKEWEEDKKAANAAYKLIYDAQELREIQPEQIDYLMGLFHTDHLPYITERPHLNKEYPTLTEMTEKAIKLLSRNSKGYFLLVEGGKIDLAHHKNWAMKALEEGVEFDQAIQKAIDIVDEEDTLIVVTADHSHVFSVGGDYPLRGTEIIGIGGVSDIDNLTFTTLGYLNGPGYKKNARDRNLTNDEAMNPEFQQDALVPHDLETHGSEDVPVYARGPMAHLFHGVHEQSYIPHAMAYASCIGSNKEHCNHAWSIYATQSSLTALKLTATAIWTYFVGCKML
ncbi:alkaline phosphatase-like isoform X3 [Parasteatoda tepidariorum]|uniref:alkaline phosphatase-like isoform X1 n=1 Tax=Parasteatoda tepidariorum TaxID=114398 RepID=UPI0039BC60AA